MNRRLVLGAVAAAGVVLLAWVAPRAHPAARWRIACDREMAQAKAREISNALGVDTSGWTATVTGGTNGTMGYFADRHPEIPEARHFSPVYPKVVLAAPGGERVVIRLTAAGEPTHWERKGYKEEKTLDMNAARRLASFALARFAGADAPSFRPVPTPSEKEGTLLIAFERSGRLTERFEATINGARVVKAELQPQYGAQTDEAMRARKKYVNWLESVAGVAVYFLGTVLAIGVYVFWAVRRAIRYRFVLPLAATTVVWGAIYWSNWMGYDERFSSIAVKTSFAENFVGAAFILVFYILLFIALGGATEVVSPRARVATLRSLFSASVFNRQAGTSIWIGLLCGPLLAALPMAVSMLRLFGSEQTGDYEASVVYAFRPWLQAIDVMIPVALLGLFGFGAAQLPRFLRKTWLANSVLAVLGTILLTTLVAPAETNPISLLLSATILFATYWQLLLRVDLLAVLSAGWCATVLWNASTLALQPAASLRTSGVVAFGWVAGLAAVSGIVALRGKRLEVDEEAAPAAVTSQREVLMKEFSIAHRVQQEMLPAKSPEIPGCTVAASCTPAQEVGGDLFDFLPLPDGRWSIGVGDVSGKGVPAALYMTLTKGLLMATTQDSADLLEIIGNVNRHVHAATERKTFVTMALGAYDPETRTFDHVRAGHNPVVWRRAGDGSTQLLNSPGLGLGIVSDRLFRRSIRVERLQLASGDTLVFYSDGITEAMNSAREQFGEERLMRSVDQSAHADAGGVREKILGDVRQFLGGIPPQDDMTVVVLRVN